jgi:RNA 3'-terminal phosphate cyclase
MRRLRAQLVKRRHLPPHYPCGVTEELPAREDLAAAIGARRELGKEYEDAVVDSFVARLDQRIAERVDEQVAETLGSKPAAKAPARAPAADNSSLVVSLVSLGAGIPITAISSENGVVGLIVSWAGIAAVNVAHALSRRRSG